MCARCGPFGVGRHRAPGAALGAQEQKSSWRQKSSCRSGSATLLEAGGQNGWFPWPCPKVGDRGAPCCQCGRGRERRISSYGYARRCFAVHATRLSEVQGAAGIMLKDHNVVTVPAASLRAERPGRLGMLTRTKNQVLVVVVVPVVVVVVVV